MTKAFPPSERHGLLERHFGVFNGVALTITMIVGSGVFLTIPLMLQKLPGAFALAGWLAAGLLMIVDGLVWSELGAALPSSGGTYYYLLRGFGENRLGRMMAFLFLWQFIISGPLEIAAGFISIAQVSSSLDPHFEAFNNHWTVRFVFGKWEDELVASIGPAQALGVLLGAVILFMLYRRVTSLGKLTVTLWLGVLGIIAWHLVEGALRFDGRVAFDFPDPSQESVSWGQGLGGAMLLAMYSYMGYYHICYVGDEVREPGRTIPRTILVSAILVCLLFIGLHLAILGTIPWRQAVALKNPPAEFMSRIHGRWAAQLVTLGLIWSSFGSCFATLLGYSRIPFGAAREGHFFSVLARVHPRHHFPHVSLWLIAGLTFFWSFFELGDVINALVTTRILGQFIAQILGLLILRSRPQVPFPFRMWLFPLPCALALIGWGFVYLNSGRPFIYFSLGILGSGTLAFLAWARWSRGWPFEPAPGSGQIDAPEPERTSNSQATASAEYLAKEEPGRHEKGF